jgi:hypothetical protein
MIWKNVDENPSKCSLSTFFCPGRKLTFLQFMAVKLFEYQNGWGWVN